MFFTVSDQPRTRYPYHWSLGKFCVSTDSGWQKVCQDTKVLLYKGYTDSARLSDILCDLADSSYTGNFCCFVYDLEQQNLNVYTDIWRSFPIYFGNNLISNLEPGPQRVHTNSRISIDSDGKVCQHRTQILTSRPGCTVDDVDQLLRKKIKLYLEYNPDPIKVFLSGGVDSLLVFSYLKNLGADYEIVWGNHVDFDDFWLQNHHDVQQNWAYKQIHHWTTPTVLASGAPGDEFMMRNPGIANLYLLHHGTDITEQLILWPHCLHCEFFGRDNYRKIYQEQQSIELETSRLEWTLSNMVLNDYQHWHLGNTLTYTPLRDLDVFLTILNIDFDTVLSQIMDSQISKQLIEHNVPGLSEVISDQKNSGNHMSNLVRFVEKPN